ncbi:DUF1501 domain-containing protein [Thermonema rossianum]|uniref:DUF1501 domain-containing protein n=1 Tax=Thermonema rossianum TaxID=55505 RepID=UPI0005715847|nr:DUF1501 domain-containing protein [Thermonema rossianum]
MKRRTFLKQMTRGVALPIVINGIPFRQLMGLPRLQRWARMSTNDKVLVIVQLHGGNDGLNTVIPVNQYSDYYNLRPNLAIPDTGSRRFITLDPLLPDEQQAGLHPDMVGLKALYDEGKLSIIQNVGYEHMNGSHFKGRDIWFGGVGYDDPISSGWIGRYLELEYEQDGAAYPEDFPNSSMPDPLGLEFGSDVSLGFHTEDTIPAAIAIPNPAGFFDLVNNLEGYYEEINVDPRGIPPTTLQNSPYGKELAWILGIEDSTDDYAQRLQELYQIGNAFQSGVVYPTTYPLQAPAGKLHNPLSLQLQIIAKLLHGGCKTKVFLVRIGGFDTHVQQVESYNNTLGAHAALLYHVASAMKAFQDDLRARGLEDRVLSVTISEFGRRARSNGSYGSDHGTVAPMFVFGKQVNPGMIGKNPDLSKVPQKGGNLSDDKEDIVDYRLVFSTILQDWFEVSSDKIPLIFPSLIDDGYQATDKLPLIGSRVTSLDNFLKVRYRLESCYPNPATDHTTISFYINSPQHVELSIVSLQGERLRTLVHQPMAAGTHHYTVDLSGWSPGTYLCRLRTPFWTDTKKIIKL